jgi:hypothetical protein
VEPSIIAATAALLGVTVGNLLGRSAEYRKWRRSERHAACVAFLTEAQVVNIRFMHLAASDTVLEGVRRAGDRDKIAEYDRDATASGYGRGARLDEESSNGASLVACLRDAPAAV